jgi:hypothetical protein
LDIVPVDNTIPARGKNAPVPFALLTPFAEE